MNNLPRVSLDDTLSLVQLARETALARGKEAQAQKLTPIMDNMRELAATARNTQPTAPPDRNIMAQGDFQKLLETSQARSDMPLQPSSATSAMERNRMIQAMSAADMSEVDIARQFAMPREEVRLVLNLQQKLMTN